MEDLEHDRVCQQTRLGRIFLLKSIFFLFFMRRAWLAILLLGLIQPVPAQADSFSPETVLEKFSRDLWYVGKGILPEDSFTYAICDFKHRFLTQSGSCYHMRLNFYAELESQGRDVWVVQVEISDADDDHFHRHIFLMDSKTLEITTDHIGADYAVSAEKTIMYLAQFAREQIPKPLVVGKTWGSVSSTLDVGSDLIVVSREKSEFGNVFILEFGLFEPSTFVISRDLPFPISASVFDPHHVGINPPVLFAFEMLDHNPTRNDVLNPDDVSGSAIRYFSNETLTVFRPD